MKAEGEKKKKKRRNATKQLPVADCPLTFSPLVKERMQHFSGVGNI